MIHRSAWAASAAMAAVFLVCGVARGDVHTVTTAADSLRSPAEGSLRILELAVDAGPDPVAELPEETLEAPLLQLSKMYSSNDAMVRRLPGNPPKAMNCPSSSGWGGHALGRNTHEPISPSDVMDLICASVRRMVAKSSRASLSIS